MLIYLPPHIKDETRSKENEEEGEGRAVDSRRDADEGDSAKGVDPARDAPTGWLLRSSGYQVACC